MMFETPKHNPKTEKRRCVFKDNFVYLYFKKPYQTSVPKIVEITHAVYQGLSKR